MSLPWLLSILLGGQGSRLRDRSVALGCESHLARCSDSRVEKWLRDRLIELL